MSNEAPSSQPKADSHSHRWWGVVVMAIAGFTLGADLYMLPALLPSLAKELQIQLTTAGQMLTLYAAISAVAAPVLVVMFRQANRRTLLIISISALVLTNLLVALIPGAAGFALTRVLAALAGAVLGPIRTAAAGGLAPKGMQTRAIAIATAGQSAALVVGAPVGLWVAGDYGWRVAFAGAAGVSLLALIGVFVFIPSMPSTSKATLGQQLSVLKNRKVLLVLVSNAASLCGIFVLLTFLRPVLAQITTLGPTASSSVFATYGVAGMAGNALAGWAGGRLSSTRVMLGGLVLAGLALIGISVLFLWPPSPVSTALVLLLVVLWGGGAWAFYSMQFSRLVELAPTAPAAAVSWASPASFVGISLGATLGGLTLQHGSAGLLGAAAGLCFLVGAGCVLATTLEPQARLALSSQEPGN
ncbi:MAG: MFS transporter [Hyalangium sp.]|uniref:MFS transporter n=1 Tax=Hyalangium sp. TaxID=2028555 RepID=UPI00389B2CB6